MYSSTIRVEAFSIQFQKIYDTCVIRLNLEIDTIYIKAGADIPSDKIIISNGIPGESISVTLDMYQAINEQSSFSTHVKRTKIDGTYTFNSYGQITITSKDYCRLKQHIGSWIRYKFIYHDQTYYIYERFI